MSKLPYRESLEAPIPQDVRLEIYKVALDAIENNKNYLWEKVGLSGPWLCLFLPCLLLGEKKDFKLVSLKLKNERIYDYLPEIKKEDIVDITVLMCSCSEENHKKENAIRVKVLQKSIKIIENEQSTI